MGEQKARPYASIKRTFTSKNKCGRKRKTKHEVEQNSIDLSVAENSIQRFSVSKGIRVSLRACSGILLGGSNDRECLRGAYGLRG